MHNEIREFEKIIKQNSRTILGDPFIKLYIEDLLKNIRTQVLLNNPNPNPNPNPHPNPNHTHAGAPQSP